MITVYRIPDQPKGALVTPSAKHPGTLQISWFDSRGFWGDTERDDEAQAVDEVTRDGYVPATREFFDELTSTDEWAAGMRSAAIVARHNAGKFTAQVSDACENQPHAIR